MEGFTHEADDSPEPRELRLVAMHLPDWEDIGRDLDLDQATLDQCKKSNRFRRVVAKVASIAFCIG